MDTLTAKYNDLEGVIALFAQYKDDIYSSGLSVYTTIRKANQEAANAAVREGVLDYDSLHGFRGPEKTLDLSRILAENPTGGLDDALVYG